MEWHNSQMVHLLGEYVSTSYAATLPHGFCTDTQSICLRWCGMHDVGVQRLGKERFMEQHKQHSHR